MNKKVVEVLSILIHKMLNNEELWKKQEDIVIELENKGYTIENISEAFDIMFSEIISVGNQDYYMDYEMHSGYNRVFTKVEKFYFNSEIKSIIYKLNAMGILTADELEVIIFRMFQLASVNDLESDLIWEIISEVVDDSDLLLTISAEFNEFTPDLLKQQRVN